MRLRHAAVATLLLLVPGTPIWANPATATMTATFRPGLIWSDFVYGWTITAAPGEIPFNDVEIQMASLANLSTGTYAGPGVVQNPPAGNPNLFRIRTANPAGFGNPVSFTVESVNNPTVVEGFPAGYLTLGGAKIAGSDFTSRPPAAARPAMPAPQRGAMNVNFAPGTFAALSAVDLFESSGGAGSAHLGFGAAASDGSASISLLRPVGSDDVWVGETETGASYGSLLFSVTPVPETDVWALMISGLGILGWRLRKRSESAVRHVAA